MRANQLHLGRSVRALAVGILAGAILIGAGARQTAQAADARALVPDPATATVRIAQAGDSADVVRFLAIERGKSVFANTEFRVKRVSVGDPGLVEVVVLSPTQLQFVAREPGSTNVLLWDASGVPQAAIEVEVGAVGTALQRQLNRLVPGSDIRVEGAAGATVLSGSVPSVVAAERALAVSRAFAGKDNQAEVVNLLDVGGNQQVMLKVVIAEMSRTITREFGTNFNALIEAGSGNISMAGLLGGLTAPDGAGGTLISEAINLAAGFSQYGALQQLQVFLDVLDERGLTHILAEPTLVARSGQSASFLVGGEVPIPIAQGGAFGSITVEYKPFGVGLQFTPTVLGPGRIHLDVTPEVSQPDFTFGTEIDGTIVPAFNTRRAATSVELEHGQSFVVAGLLNEDLREQVSQYPVLGQVPILGALFRSSKYQRNETELVIIVTPSLIKPLGPGPHKLPTDSFVDPAPWEFYMLGALEGRAPVQRDPTDEQRYDDGGLIGDAGYQVPANSEENTDDE